MKLSLVSYARPVVALALAWAVLGADVSFGQGRRRPPLADVPAAGVIEVDPVGQPLLGGRPRGPRILLWSDGAVWHLRTATREKPQEFSGTVRVVGGRVTKIFNYQGMETRKKGKRDLGLLNGAKTTITFRMRTGGREDGFDFTVSEGAEKIEFDLRVNGYQHPGLIAIGAAAASGPGAVFTLPAHPLKALGDDEDAPGQPE